MARALGRAAERRDALDHVGIERAPLEGLQRAHRPAGDERQLLHAELLGHQPVLHPHIVARRHQREARPVIGLRRIARRRGQAVAQHVRDDDEILVRIERHARPDQPLIVVMLARIPGRVDDDVVLRRVHPAECLVGEFATAQRRASLQPHVAKFEDFVVLRHSLLPSPGVCFPRTYCGGRLNGDRRSRLIKRMTIERIGCAEPSHFEARHRPRPRRGRRQ